MDALSRRKPGFEPRWDYQNKNQIIMNHLLALAIAVSAVFPTKAAK